jgi:tetratricopeptide (TPR) repeat protein
MFISHAQLDPAQRDAESKACNQLGELYNKTGRYDFAAQYFERHFQILNGQAGLARKGSSSMLLKDAAMTSKPRTVTETPQLRAAKVQLGVAKANAQMAFFFDTVADPKGVDALLLWKAKNTFGDYIPPTQRVMT